MRDRPRASSPTTRNTAPAPAAGESRDAHAHAPAAAGDGRPSLLHRFKRARATSPETDSSSPDRDTADRLARSTTPSALHTADADTHGDDATRLRCNMTQLNEHAPRASDESVDALIGESSLQLGEHPTSPAAVRARVDAARTAPPRADETWFLVPAAWFRRWHAHPAAAPPLDTAPLRDESGFALRAGLVEGADYELVPAAAWDLLAAQYTLAGPALPRTVLPGATPTQPARVEVYPPVFTLAPVRMSVPVCPAPALQQLTTVTLSASEPLACLKAQARHAGVIPAGARDDHVQFVRVYDERLHAAALARGGVLTGSELAASDPPPEVVPEYGIPPGVAHPAAAGARSTPPPTLQALQLDTPAFLAVDVRVGTRWMYGGETAAAAAEDSGAASADARAREGGMSLPSGPARDAPAPAGPACAAPSPAAPAALPPHLTRALAGRAGGATRGQRGLANLGNTCFMNSALQCLSNTEELRQYFLREAHWEELNVDNPLGMGGALAGAYGRLLQTLWSGSSGAVVPREFKTALSRFAPQFTGYAQQDSQELLAFLLDGLHEDLNRIRKKPYIEAPDWPGGSAADMVRFAGQQWDIYKARNDSIIVDLFQGQYRSTLVCPVCAKVSVKFDPFMYLTLPIPNTRRWRGRVYVVPRAGPTVRADVQLPATANIARLRERVAQLLHMDARALAVGEVWSHHVYRWLPDYEPIRDVSAGDCVYLWELPMPFSFPRPLRSSEGTSAPRLGFFQRAGRSVDEIESASVPPPACGEGVRAVDAHGGCGHVDADRVVLPVYSCVAPARAGGAAGLGTRFGSFRRTLGDAIGIPFFVAVRHDASLRDVEYAVMEAYVKYARSPDGVGAEEAGADEAGAEETGMEEVGAKEAGAVNAILRRAREAMSVHAGAGGDASDYYGEDGEGCPAEEAVSSEAQAPPAPAPPPPSPPPSPAPPTPPFRLRFAPPSAAEPLCSGDDLGEQRSEPLGDRMERLKVHGTWPALFTGGALVCVWDAAAAHALFGAASADATWGPVDKAEDPEFAKGSAQLAAGTGRAPRLQLEDCLDEFTKEEQLGEDDPWYCPTCKELRQATKKFDLWKVPDILVVHLKRFSAGRTSRDKLDNLIDFPLDGLDLSDRVEGPRLVHAQALDDPPATTRLSDSLTLAHDAHDDQVVRDRPVYDLYAVDNHFGGLGGGHYTAFAKNPTDARWYNFDDSSVRPVSDPESVKTPAAYLLFYRRRTNRPIGGKSRDMITKVAPLGPDGVQLPTPIVSPPPRQATPTYLGDTPLPPSPSTDEMDDEEE
ncbi:ubiquitinyl hydrolase 1 [Malassezia sp. CBS 17886]|nr:ubiquitinyl hydrolase 1 [Malassezia sp. CBS 17886]